VDADCIKLTSYFGERHRTNGTCVGDALIDLYSRHEIAMGRAPRPSPRLGGTGSANPGRLSGILVCACPVFAMGLTLFLRSRR